MPDVPGVAGGALHQPAVDEHGPADRLGQRDAQHVAPAAGRAPPVLGDGDRDRLAKYPHRQPVVIAHGPRHEVGPIPRRHADADAGKRRGLGLIDPRCVQDRLHHGRRGGRRVILGDQRNALRRHHFAQSGDQRHGEPGGLQGDRQRAPRQLQRNRFVLVRRGGGGHHDVHVDPVISHRPDPASPGSGQRVRQVGQQVLDVLDTDGQPDQVGRHLERGPGDAGMGHQVRVLDQRLDPAQRLGQGEQPRP